MKNTIHQAVQRQGFLVNGHVRLFKKNFPVAVFFNDVGFQLFIVQVFYQGSFVFFFQQAVEQVVNGTVYPHHRTLPLHVFDVVEKTRCAAAAGHYEVVVAFRKQMQYVFFQQAKIFFAFCGEDFVNALAFFLRYILVQVKKRKSKLLAQLATPMRLAATHKADEKYFHDVQICRYANVQISGIKERVVWTS